MEEEERKRRRRERGWGKGKREKERHTQRQIEERRKRRRERRSGCPWMLADRRPLAVNDLTTFLYPAPLRSLRSLPSLRFASPRLAWPRSRARCQVPSSSAFSCLGFSSPSPTRRPREGSFCGRPYGLLPPIVFAPRQSQERILIRQRTLINDLIIGALPMSQLPIN